MASRSLIVETEAATKNKTLFNVEKRRQWSPRLPSLGLVFKTFDLVFGFCGGRKTGEPGEKPSEQGENQEQTQPT